ncbi:translation factor GUF1 homolog, chloroplastic-like isoform X3 [Zingiber officinale]|uniref:translation factor GUF1 homolog, chloroplastic-like isoform X3 n=1 Tax=Zingiber officinale TaxID=94328 RepID=UPI001C4D7E56|nr:translation factor GUF1 homolog, chloroplastic-like isoform X3 [Zingiber officinale]XP_042444725.1 translation factor GUF1 homolog, chloroplastic-like isoform X3 [Zingiber officinale]XP_042444726.1 translation factor GUF1 homolog, chloroplastic-like isoform X3 [Zingiber officinale]
MRFTVQQRRGITEFLNAIITRIPPPKDISESPMRALIFDRNRDHAWQTIVTNGVKIYNASRGISKGPGFKQLTGNLKQNGGVKCGYYVMWYMKEIVLDEYPQLERKFTASKNKQYYNQSQYDEVRSEWSEFVYFYVGA